MYKEFKEWVQLQIAQYHWKKNNRHNSTVMGKLFDIKRVHVGNRTYGTLNAYTFLKDRSQLTIGNYCSIAENVSFVVGGEHNTLTASTYPFRQLVLGTDIDTLSKGDIVIDDDVWIGFGATILSGVHIGQGAVVAAGAVVLKDVPAYTVVGGIPAKVIKYRFEPEIIDEMLKLDYSKLTKEMIEEHVDDLYQELTDVRKLEWMPRK